MSKKALKNYQTAMSQIKGHKILHKVRKHWVVISLFALGLAGGTLLTNDAASANAVNQSQGNKQSGQLPQGTSQQQSVHASTHTLQNQQNSANQGASTVGSISNHIASVNLMKSNGNMSQSPQGTSTNSASSMYSANVNKASINKNSIMNKAKSIHTHLLLNSNHKPRTRRLGIIDDDSSNIVYNNPKTWPGTLYKYNGYSLPTVSINSSDYGAGMFGSISGVPSDANLTAIRVASNYCPAFGYRGGNDDLVFPVQNTGTWTRPQYNVKSGINYNFKYDQEYVDPQGNVSIHIAPNQSYSGYTTNSPGAGQYGIFSDSNKSTDYDGFWIAVSGGSMDTPSSAYVGQGFTSPQYWVSDTGPTQGSLTVDFPYGSDWIATNVNHEAINYTYSDQNVSQTTINGRGNFTLNSSNAPGLNSDYVVSSDVTGSYSDGTLDVPVVPRVKTDTINYVLSDIDAPAGYQGTTGQLGQISLTGEPNTNISDSSFTNVPANYHIIAMPTLQYDGSSHNVDIAPNSENLNVTYTDQNGKTYAGAINGSYNQKVDNVTSDYALPAGYHLNDNQDASYVFNSDQNQDKDLSISGNQQSGNVILTIQKYDGSTPTGKSTISVPESGLTGNNWTIDPNQYAPAGYHAQQGVLHGTFTPNGLSQNNVTFTYSAQAGSAITVNYINQDGHRIGGGSIPGNVDDQGSIVNKIAIPSGYNVNSGQNTNYHVTVAPQAPVNVQVTGLDSSQIPGNGTFTMTVQKMVGNNTISSVQKQVHVPGRVGDNYTITPSSYTPIGYTSTSNPVQGSINANGISSNAATFIYRANAGASVNVTYKEPNGRVITSGQIKGLVDSTGNVYNSVPMPGYYHYVTSTVQGGNGSNVSYHITTNPQDIVITAAPDTATDTINFDYNGQQIASYRHTGNNVNASGASDTSFNDSNEVPAGWHNTSTTQFNYDNGTHVVSLQPNTVTEVINYQDTGDNRQGHNYIGNQGSHTFTYNDDRATAAGNNSLQILANSKPAGLNANYHVISTQGFRHDNGSYTETVYVARDTVNDNVNYVEAPSDGNSNEEPHAHLLGSTPETLYADADYNLNNVASTLSVPDHDEVSAPNDLTTNFHTQLLGAAPQNVNLPVFNLTSLENAIAGSTEAKYASMNQSIAANAASEANETNTTNGQVNSINARFQSEKASEASAENSQAGSAENEITSLMNDLHNNSGASQAVQNNPSANSELSSYEAEINGLLNDMKSNPANAGSDMRKIIELETKTNNIVSSASNSASVSADLSSVSSSAAAQSINDSTARSAASSAASASASSIASSASSAVASEQTSIAASAAAQSVADSLKRSAEASSAASQFGSMTSSIASSASSQSTADSIARSQASSAASSSVASVTSSIIASLAAHDSADTDSQASQASSTANQDQSAINVDSLANSLVNSLKAELAQDQAGEASAKATGNTSAANSYAADASKAASGVDSAAASAETSSTISSMNKSNASSAAANDSANVNSYANGADSMANSNSGAISNDPSASSIINSAEAALASEKAAAQSALAAGNTSVADSLAAEASAEASMIDSAAVSAANVANEVARDSANINNDSSNANSMVNHDSAAINTDPLASGIVNSANSAINSAEAAEAVAARNGNMFAADSYAALASNEASMLNSAAVSAETALSDEARDEAAVSANASNADNNAAQNSGAVNTDPSASAIVTNDQNALSQAESAEASAKAAGNTSAADSYATNASIAASAMNSAIVSAKAALSAEAKDANNVNNYANHAAHEANNDQQAIDTDPAARNVINSAQSALQQAQSAEKSATAAGNTSAADSYATNALEEAADMRSAAESAVNALSAETSEADAMSDYASGASSMAQQNHEALINDPTANSIATSANDALNRDKASEAQAQANGNTSAAGSYARNASEAASMINSAATSAALIMSANSSESTAVANDTANAHNAVAANSSAINSDQVASSTVNSATKALNFDQAAEASARANGNVSAANSLAANASTEASMIESAAASASVIASEEANDASNAADDVYAADNDVAQNYDAINKDPKDAQFITGNDMALKHDQSAINFAKAKGDIQAADSYARDASGRASAIGSAAANATDLANSTTTDASSVNTDVSNASNAISSAQVAFDVDPVADSIASDAKQSLTKDQSGEQSALDNGNITAANSYAADASAQTSTIDSAVVSADYESSAGAVDVNNINQDSNAVSKDADIDEAALLADPTASAVVNNATNEVRSDVSLAISAKDAGNILAANSYAEQASNEESMANSAATSAITSSTGSTVAWSASESAVSLSNSEAALSGSTSVGFGSEDNRASAMYNDMNDRTDSLNNHITLDSVNATSVEASNTDSLNNSVNAMSFAFNKSLFDASVANASSFSTVSAFASASASAALSQAQSTAAKDGTASAQSALAVAETSINADHSGVVSMINVNKQMASASLAFAETSASSAINNARHDASNQANSLDKKIDTNTSNLKGQLSNMAKSANATDKSVQADIWALRNNKANKSDVQANIAQLADNTHSALNKANNALEKQINNIVKSDGHNNAEVKDELVQQYNKLQNDLKQKADWGAIGNDESKINALASELGSKADLAKVEEIANDLTNVSNNITDLHNGQNVMMSRPHAIYDVDKLGIGQSGIFHSQLITSKSVPKNYRYFYVLNNTAVHTDPDFNHGKIAKVLRTRHSYTVPIKRIFIIHRRHGGNLVRFEIKIGRRNYFVTGQRHYVRNSYVQPREMRHHHWIKMLRGALIYKGTHFTRHNHIRGVHAGSKVRVLGITTIRSGRVRFYIGHGHYITANKNYVRVI